MSNVDDENLPQSIAQSTMMLAGIPVIVHVLDDGRRVIDSDSAARLLEFIANGGVE